MNFIKYITCLLLLSCTTVLFAQDDQDESQKSELNQLLIEIQNPDLTEKEQIAISERINEIYEENKEEKIYVPKAKYLKTADEVLTDFEEESNEIIEELINIAVDPDVVEADRRKAFEMLADSKEPKALYFLIDRIDEQFFVRPVYSGADEEINIYGAFVSVYPQDPKDGWALIPYIFSAMKKERSDDALLFYMEILFQTYDEITATEDLTKLKLDEAAGPTEVDNLKRLLKFMGEQ